MDPGSTRCNNDVVVVRLLVLDDATSVLCWYDNQVPAWKLDILVGKTPMSHHNYMLRISCVCLLRHVDQDYRVVVCTTRHADAVATRV